MKFKTIFSHYENVCAIKDGEVIFIDPEVLKNTDFKGKIVKKIKRKWLVPED